MHAFLGIFLKNDHGKKIAKMICTPPPSCLGFGVHIRLPSFEDSLFSTKEQRQDAKLEKVMKIPIDEIHAFKNHPFHVRQDEDMQKLIDSVQENGIFVPVLVHPDKGGNGYEMISRHRRKFALEFNGAKEIDAIVRDLDDDQATIIMVDSNIQ